MTIEIMESYMIALIDYGMGNLRSVQKAIESQGARVAITQKPKDVRAAEKVVLPGVGAIKPAVEKLNHLGLIEPIKDAIEAQKPFLGICLGFQLLFERSTEGGPVEGLGFLPGHVERFTNLKVPHMGWNELMIKNDCPLFKNIENKSHVYFCHSYYVKPKNDRMIATTTDYGLEFTSSIWANNIYGVQFHPEKSQTIGLKILENFIKLD